MPSQPSWQRAGKRQAAVVLEVLVEAHAQPALAQNAGQRHLAHLQRLTAQIRAVQIEQVEGIEEGRALPTKTKPRRLRGLAVQRTRQRGSGGTEAVRTRLMNVSRASFGKVQSVSGALKSCQ